MGMSHPNRSPLSSTGAPDIGEVREVMTSLCDTWDAGAHDRGVHYRGELGASRAVAIRTHAHHAVRTARAVLHLDPTTGGIEIIPLVRLIYECAITSAWLLVTDGAGESLIRDGARQRRTALESAAMPKSDDAGGLEQARRVLAELEGASSFAFEQRCLSLQNGPHLYLMYRILSAESHAGLAIADFYSVSNDQAAIGVSFDPGAASSIRPATLGVAACMLLLAVNADELARAKPHRTTQIAKAAKRLGVGTRIVRKDGFELPDR